MFMLNKISESESESEQSESENDRIRMFSFLIVSICICTLTLTGQWRSEGIWRPGANFNFAPPPLKKIPKKIIIQCLVFN